MLQSKKSALGVLNVAILLFAFAGIIGQYVSADAITVVAIRVLFSSLALGIFLVLRRMELLPRGKKYVTIALVAGALQGFSWVAFFTSIKVSSVAIAMITFSTAPLFVSVMEPVAFREKFRWKDFGFALIALVGVLIATPELSLENTVTIGIFWGMISSSTYGMLMLFNRVMSEKYTGAQVCFWEHFIAMCVTMPFVLYNGVGVSATDLGLLVLLGTVCTSVPYSLLVQTQKVLPAQLVTLMNGAETVYAIVLACILLKEMPTWQEVLGGAVILTAVMIAGMKTQVTKTDAPA